MTIASDKQIAYINKLIDTHVVDESYISRIQDWIDNDPTKITRTLASFIIDTLKATPYKNPNAIKAVPASGYYTFNDKVYKVQVSPNSGYSYAKVFDPETGWSYASGVIYKLANATHLTLDQAKKYGKLYGCCVICGRTLTDEGSIEAGIGPICAGKI